jgi:hypothetical protein
MLRTKVTLSITCMDTDDSAKRYRMAVAARDKIYAMDRNGELWSRADHEDFANTAIAVYIEHNDEIDQLLYNILTGDGAQTENLDAEFMRESIGEIAPDRDDVEFTSSQRSSQQALGGQQW